MSTTAVILNQPSPGRNQIVPPLQLKQSPRCINMQLMNMRSMFSQFAAATMGRKLKGSGCSFFSFLFFIHKYDFIDLQRGPLLGSPSTTQSFVLIYSLFPQVFFFFSCKVFHIQVTYCTSFPSQIQTFLSSLTLNLFFPFPLSHSLSTLTFRRSHQTPGNSETQNLIICALSLGLQSLWSPVNMCFQPLFFYLKKFHFASLSPRCFVFCQIYCFPVIFVHQPFFFRTSQSQLPYVQARLN